MRFGNSNLYAALLAIVAVDVSNGLTYPLLNLILESKKVGVVLIGFNSAMMPIGILVVGPFIQRLTKYFSTKLLVQCAILLNIIVLILLPAFPNLGVWFFLRFLLGVAGGVLYGLSEAWVMQFSEEGSRGRTAALFNSLLCLGFAFGPFIIPIVGIEGWAPFITAVVFLLIAAVPLMMLNIAEDDFEVESRSDGFTSFIKCAPLLLFAVLTVTMFDAVMLAFFPIYGLKNGLDLQTASWALGLAILGNAALQLPVGWMLDHWSKTKLLWIAAISTAALTITLPFTLGSWLLWLNILFLGTGAYSIYTIALATLGEQFKGAMLVSGAAAFSAMWGLGGVLGPPIAGAALNNSVLYGIPIILLAIYLFFTAILFIEKGNLVRKKKP